MKIDAAKFDRSAPDLKSCPNWNLPEIAFIGRSNVGKSSLLNALVGRRDLAKISATPGKTQLINFFTVNDRWSLVDLPGYGFAAVGHQRRDEFNAAVSEYLEKRQNIICVFVLIDSRLPPQSIDLQFLRWLVGCAVPFALVFTKTDKQSDTRTREGIKEFTRAMTEAGMEVPSFFSTSAKTKVGRDELLGFIGRTLEVNRRAR
jgi:GTP-binding protein